MSAFVVNDSTIVSIIGYLNTFQHGQRGTWVYRPLVDLGYKLSDLGNLAQDMLNMNYDAVNQRYNEDEQPRTIKISPFVVNPDKVGAYKALNCLLYQCCEGDVMERELYKALQEVQANIAKYIVESSHEYDKKPWG